MRRNGNALGPAPQPRRDDRGSSGREQAANRNQARRVDEQAGTAETGSESEPGSGEGIDETGRHYLTYRRGTAPR